MPAGNPDGGQWTDEGGGGGAHLRDRVARNRPREDAKSASSTPPAERTPSDATNTPQTYRDDFVPGDQQPIDGAEIIPAAQYSELNMPDKLPLHHFTEPMHADMRLIEPDALSIAWLARYALTCRETPDLLETIRSELATVLQAQYSDDDLSRLWIRHEPGCTFDRGGVRLFLGAALAAFETAKLSMTVPMLGKRRSAADIE